MIKFTSVPSKRLSESIGASATSFKLNNVLGWDGEALAAADFGTTLYVVFRNEANTLIEFMEVDPTDIVNESIDITRRGLDYTGDLTTEVTANKLAWVKNDTIVELGASSPQMYQAIKEYVDAIAVAGAPDASTTTKGIAEEATQAETDAGTAAGTAARLFVNPSKVRAKNYNDYVVDTGAADAYAIAPSPAITAYAAGQIFTFKVANANTTASTLNVNGLGAKSIKKSTSNALESNDLSVGQIVTVAYDGTNFQLLAHNDPIFGAFGDGSDGDVTISAPTTLTHDMYYNNLVVTSTLTTAGYRVFVRGTISGAGTVQAGAGTAGSGVTGGAAAAGYFSNTAGSNGGAASTAGTAGTSPTYTLGSNSPAGTGTGGASGNGNAGAASGGAGSRNIPYEFGKLAFTTLHGVIFGQTSLAKIVAQPGAPGGGGGGNTGSNNGGAGGGGGASGGVVFIAARIWAGTFTIKALGGAGGNGTVGTNGGNYGGGGGGGGNGGNGGVSIVVYLTKTWSGTYTLTGGAAGTGAAGGTGSTTAGVIGSNGTAGEDGSHYEYSITSLFR